MKNGRILSLISIAAAFCLVFFRLGGRRVTSDIISDYEEVRHQDLSSVKIYTHKYNKGRVDSLDYSLRDSDSFFYRRLHEIYPYFADPEEQLYNMPRIVHGPKKGCKWSHGVTLIKVRRDAFGRRQLLRDLLKAQHVDFLVFVLGTPREGESEDVDAKLMAELDEYDDIVIGNFEDSYSHIRSKEYFKLWYYATQCDGAQMFSLDDDVIPKWHLMEFEGPVICYTSLFKWSKPMRGLRDKWFITYEDYPLDQYPAYCDGKAFSVGKSAAVSMVDQAEKRDWNWKIGTCGDAFSTGIFRVLGKVPLDGRDGGKFLSHDVAKIEDAMRRYAEMANLVDQGITSAEGDQYSDQDRSSMEWLIETRKWIKDLKEYHAPQKDRISDNAQEIF